MSDAETRNVLMGSRGDHRIDLWDKSQADTVRTVVVFCGCTDLQQGNLDIKVSCSIALNMDCFDLVFLRNSSLETQRDHLKLAPDFTLVPQSFFDSGLESGAVDFLAEQRSQPTPEMFLACTDLRCNQRWWWSFIHQMRS